MIAYSDGLVESSCIETLNYLYILVPKNTIDTVTNVVEIDIPSLRVHRSQCQSATTRLAVLCNCLFDKFEKIFMVLLLIFVVEIFDYLQ